MSEKEQSEIEQAIEKIKEKVILPDGTEAKNVLGTAKPLLEALALLSSVQAEQACPVCKGGKLMMVAGKPQNIPCSACGGSGSMIDYLKKGVEELKLIAGKPSSFEDGFKTQLALKAAEREQQLSLLTQERDKLKKLLRFADCPDAGSKHNFDKCLWCKNREAALADKPLDAPLENDTMKSKGE